MRKHLLVTLVAAVAALGFAASIASAQCSVQHPSYNRAFQGYLVQAMVSCGNAGGSAINTTTEGGVDACQPIETPNEKNGGEPNGWRWNPAYSKGRIRLIPYPTPGVWKRDTPLLPAVPGLNPPDTTDLRVELNLDGIIASDSPLGATGTGMLATLARATLNDREGGEMTVIDFPAGFPFSLHNGQTRLRTSVDALLNSIGQPGLPHCSVLEIVMISVLDENGNPFGVLGAWLP